MEDIYITMLRFGKSKLQDGFRLNDLVYYLKNAGFVEISEHSIILSRYFNALFFSDENSDAYPPNLNARFFLRPDCYVQLLDYDNMLETRKEAREAKRYAIIAIALNIIAIIVSIILR